MFVGRTLFASLGLAGPPGPNNPPNPGDPPVPMVIDSQSGDFASATVEILGIDLARILVTLSEPVPPEQTTYVATARVNTNFVFPSLIAAVGVADSTTIEVWLSFIPIAANPPVPPPPPTTGIDSNLFNVELVGFVLPAN